MEEAPRDSPLTVIIAVCGVWHQQGLHADPALRPPGGLQEVFRQDHPDGGGPEEAAPQVHHVPGQGPQDQAERSPGHCQGGGGGGRWAAQVSVRIQYQQQHILLGLKLLLHIWYSCHKS